MTTRQFNLAELAELIKESVSQLLKPIEIQIEGLTELAQQNDRALRGNNGTVGVVARVEKLELRLGQLEGKVEQLVETVTKLATLLEVKTERKSDSISKSELFDKLVLPIGIAGFSVFLFTYMPKIIAMLGG